MRQESCDPIQIKVEVDAPACMKVRTRRVGYVPVPRHNTGYNYWYKQQTRKLIDPFIVSDGQGWPGWAYGDTFEVYPGEDGPIDSIRWEVFAEALQDYQLLQALDISPNDLLLAPLKSYRDFPKTEQWRKKVKRQLLTKGAVS